MNPFLRKTPDRSQPNRRDFLVQSSCASLGITSAVNTLAHLKLMGTAAAQDAGDSYKALICVFLNGGADTNNLLIPLAGSARSQYETGRGVPSYAGGNGGIAIPVADITAAGTQLSPLNPVSEYEYAPGYIGSLNGATMGVHPSGTHLKSLFDSEELAFIANVGVLTQPNVTRANYGILASSQKPPQLFSHSDQQRQWQSSVPDRPFTSGWGGRLADMLDPAHNTNPDALSMMVSVNGLNSFQVGIQQQPYVMSASGVTTLSGYGTAYTDGLTTLGKQPFTGYNPFLAPGAVGSNYKASATGWRLAALEQMLGMSHESLFDSAYIDVSKNARVTEGLVGEALAMTDNGAGGTTLDTHFTNAYANSGGINGLTDGFAQQMRMVARLITGNSVLNNKRQIFFVQLGGWDTHTSQIPVLNNAARNDQGYYRLMMNLSCAIKGLRDSVQAAGLWNNVMAFTASDFTRTFTPNKTDETGGSDHGWGGHMMVAGGSVRGKRIYGQFPDLTVNGGMDVQGNRGRWIPTTSVDQYAAVIAKWFGVDPGSLGTIFPNLSRFVSPFTPAGRLDFMD